MSCVTIPPEMACPYFDPVRPREACGPQHAMLPLGDVWSGVCRAPQRTWQPDESVVMPLCNLGYARGTCGEFPPDEGPDAVRFTVSSDQGDAVRIYYVMERDHHPYSHGPLEYSCERREFSAPPSSEILGRQARAYIDSYLRRKAEAGER